MSSTEGFPFLSIVIPTLNSERVLEACLASIFAQDYPRERLEILIADGGSIDRTCQILSTYAEKGEILLQVLHNRLQTAEAGKALGVRNARGEIVAFIDSDNILPDSGWLQKMTLPFGDKEIIAAEPLEYTYRREDGFITRYCALLGMNDPFCLFRGNYDRYCYLTGRWTEMPVEVEEKGTYLKITPDPERMPTFGANGFLMRRELLLEHLHGDYLFDIDLLVDLGRKSLFRIAKVRTGIIHIFSGSLRTFLRKQTRRIRDYLYYQRSGMRSYPWTAQSAGLTKFVLYSILVIPLLWQSVIGYSRQRDWAWGFHPLACWLTLFTYAANSLFYGSRATVLNRADWSA